MRKSKLPIRIILLFLPVLVMGETVEPIQFSADKMEYTYKEGQERVKCIGHARIERSDFFLKGNTIILFGKDRNIAKAYDNVRMINKIDNVTIDGHYAEYYNTNSYMKVFKSPRLTSTNQHLVITSAVMESFLKENRSVAMGDVKITQTNYTAYGEKGEFFQNKDLIELTGGPIVYYGRDKFQARKIVVYIKKNLVKLYNDVFARILPDKEGK